MLSKKDLEDAFKIVGPIASMCGVKEEDTKIIINYLDEMKNRGVDGATAGMALRRTIKDLRR